jgi:CHAT domain-containing protein
VYHPPGLLSGLVLAGANRPPQAGRDDGVLTAQAVGELNLQRTRLAVLSACETGLGKEVSGEGVLGLQRAFQLAGARSVIASLWQVPDDPTQMLMERFYRNLLDGKMSKLESLRQAQLWLLREGSRNPEVIRGIVNRNRGMVRRARLPIPEQEDRLPPFYWAAFVLSGDWR